METSQISQRILAAMPDAQVEVHDLTGGGDHFEARIVSAAFEGKNRVARHRLIYGLFEEEMKGPIHAFTLQTLTPGEAQ